MEGLRGIFWNCEGFRDKAKHLFVQESVREYHLDFIALSEMGRSNFATSFLNQLTVRYDFMWVCAPPRGRSGVCLWGLMQQLSKLNMLRRGIFVLNLCYVIKMMVSNGY